MRERREGVERREMKCGGEEERVREKRGEVKREKGKERGSKGEKARWERKKLLEGDYGEEMMAGGVMIVL